MPGFIRRFGFFPGIEVITQIEGVVIVDLPPPGPIAGVSTGTVAIAGEFADMTFATTVDGTGAVTVLVQPQEIFSGQDLIDKTGPFDATLGDFGNDEGSGFAAVRNKRFTRLIAAPVSLASAFGARITRELPLGSDVTNPTPAIPVSGGTVAAATEFRATAGGRMLSAARVEFTALEPIDSGTDMVLAVVAVAATQDVTVAGEDFSAVVRPDGDIGIKIGDILVLGFTDATGTRDPAPALPALGAGTYRVAVDALSGTPTVLTVETLEGTTFQWVASAASPWRIHAGSDADSAPVIVLGNAAAGGYTVGQGGGSSVPVRPITDGAGTPADGTFPAAEILTPAVSTGDATQGAPLANLQMTTHPISATPFTAALQGPNTTQDASMDAAYQTALTALISELEPVSGVNIVFTARTSTIIRNTVKQNALDGSSRGLGRMGIISPALTVQDVTTVVGDSDPGVGANRDQRVIYTWPGCTHSVPEAVGFRLKTADGLTTTDGILDNKFDGFYASILSVLPPERNPGQAADPIPATLAPVLGFQRGVTRLEESQYINLRARGVSALKIGRTIGPVIQSGITSSLVSGQKNVFRRRMADFIQDSLALALLPFSKLPLTIANKDNAVAEVDTFLGQLLSEENTAAQRIEAYEVDDTSGNTPSLTAQGIFVIIVRVRLTPTSDFIVLQTEIGENVTITETAA